MKTKEIINAAMGKTKADLILKEAQYVNVYTKEILKADIVIKSDRIVHIGEDTSIFEGEETKIIKLENKIICPGLIESHMHIESSMLTLTEFSQAVIPHGTTTMVIDPHELVNVTGVNGLNALLEEAEKSPIRYLVEAPSCVPSLPGFETSGAVVDEKMIDELMNRKDIFALAEMMNYPGVFLNFEEVISKIDSAKRHGKLVEGHAPLLKGKELQAYIASGISSDHEATSGDEALEKLRLGMKLQIRQGSFAKDLENIFQKLKDTNIDSRNLLIASDDRNPIDLFELGHLDYSFRLLRKIGVNPLEAIQMMTINTATHLGLEHELGGLSPGKKADIIVVNNLDDFNVEIVIADGKILYKDGELQYHPEVTDYPDFILNTLANLTVPTIDELKIREDSREKVLVRVIGLKDHSLITKKLSAELDVKENYVQFDVENDILPVVVINRHTQEKKIGKGFVKGLGLQNGAIASTVAHDSHQLICVGTSYDLMLKAIKIIKNTNGGQVVVTDSKTTVLPLPYAGLMSVLALRDMVERTKALHNAVLDLKATISEPFMALAFISLPVIPHLKITDHGLIDVDEFTKVDVFL